MLVLAGLLTGGCTPAEACEDIADDTASALVDWAEVSSIPTSNFATEHRLPEVLRRKQSKAAGVLAGVSERFDAAECSDAEVTDLMRARMDQVRESLGEEGGIARQMLANGAEGVREIDASFLDRDDPLPS